MNDGVRLNIRPFVTADVLRNRVNVKWNKDRGRNPNGSERLNDRHFTLAQKHAARVSKGRMNIVSGTESFLDALIDAIEAASSHNRQDQESPAAVLWTDEARQWEALLPLLKDRLPIYVLGQYAPDDHTGPAYWLRCIIARTIPHPSLPAGKVPILYLPGYSRQDLRTCGALLCVAAIG